LLAGTVCFLDDTSFLISALCYYGPGEMEGIMTENKGVSDVGAPTLYTGAEPLYPRRDGTTARGEL
jgi:hypothetical protein